MTSVPAEVALHTSVKSLNPRQEDVMDKNRFANSDPSKLKDTMDGDLHLIPTFMAALFE